MKNNFFASFLVVCLLLTGCNSNKEHINENNNLEKTDEVTLKQYYDESRIDKNKTYTLDETVNSFSFPMYYTEEIIDETDYTTFNNITKIFSYSDNEKVKLSSFAGSVYVNYYYDETTSINISVYSSDFTKSNYHQKIEEYNSTYTEYQYEILLEEDNYLFYKTSDQYSINYYLVRFYSDDYGLYAYYSDYSLEKDQNDVYLALRAVLNVITEDNGDVLINDKIVSLNNFQNKKLKSYEFISSIDAYSKKLYLNRYINNDEWSLEVLFSSQYFYGNNNWKVLSNEPYIAINKDKSYKVLVNGLPEYYKFTKCTEEACENQGGTLEDLYSLLNNFYK